MAASPRPSMTPRRPYLIVMSLALAACGPPDAEKPPVVSSAPDRPPAAVAPVGAVAAAPDLVATPPVATAKSTPAPDASPAVGALVAEAPVSQAAAPALNPTDPLYYCVTGSANAPQRTPIALAPSVETLCRKAPEMGPCQYERDACRRQGGKVLTAAGTEITLQTEAEYNRRVLRVRMKSN